MAWKNGSDEAPTTIVRLRCLLLLPDEDEDEDDPPAVLLPEHPVRAIEVTPRTAAAVARVRDRMCMVLLRTCRT
jgi:hypothetical protein